ncbi:MULTISPECIES: MnmC family methyltransferase [unclassified Helicobacter]|uniref:MnmC family methyltransferase n=1 Tax=unclassified Helicobacter TaxID=2593540 RepID=UPI00131529DA|nr:MULTISPECIES: MnmC family methyltransferase [unclassified Helicobacter]
MSDKKIQSADGSQTYYSHLFRECYHSLKDGALTETLHKHIFPPILFGDFLRRKKIKILDLCFGLGYNSFATFWVYRKKYCYGGEITILSPEIDVSVFDKILDIEYPNEWGIKRDIILSLEKEKKVSLDSKFTLEVKIIDARKLLQEIKDLEIDIVYYDVFSPKSTPELWDRDFFSALHRILDSNGMITTYTTHQSIYEIARKTGFRVYKYKNGYCRKSTIFTKNLLLHHPSLDLKA